MEKIIEKLYGFAERIKHPVIKEHLMEIIADIKTSTYSLKTIVESGHVFSGYPILRKILTSFSLVIFFHSLIRQTSELISKIDPKEYEREEDLKKELESFVLNFPSEWKIIRLYGDFVVIKDVKKELKGEKPVPIQDFKTFTHIREKILRGEIKIVEPKDKFLMELLDFIIAQGEDFFSGDISSTITSCVVWDEYRKLSKVVHDPIFIDFPPFSSIVEYVGFIHHLRKVKNILEKTFLNYRKIIRKNRKKRKGRFSTFSPP